MSSFTGITVREPNGSQRFTVTSEDEGFVYVKRADSTKKALAAGGGYTISRREFTEEWLPNKVAAMQEP